MGLWIQIFPNLDQISTECKREWEANLNACSQEMMAILTREYNKQMVLLDTEIDNIEASLRPFMQHTLYSELQANLRNDLSTYNRGVLQKKESKFWREHTAISEGRAYKWSTNPQKKHQKNKQYMLQQQSNHMNSISKSKKEFDSSHNPKILKGHGKFKRSRNNNGSPEQDRKKRTMETTLESGSSAHIGEVRPSRPKSDTSNMVTNEIDPSPNIPTKYIESSSIGCLKPGSQSPLNQAWGSSPSQTNRGAGNPDAYVTQIQQNPSA